MPVHIKRRVREISHALGQLKIDGWGGPVHTWVGMLVIHILQVAAQYQGVSMGVTLVLEISGADDNAYHFPWPMASLAD